MITGAEMQNHRQPETGHSATSNREMKRIPYQVPIYQTSNLDKMGLVRNISEKGVGVKGFEVQVDETVEFVIVPTEFIDIDPIVFRANCRWVKQDDDGEYISGFQITDLSVGGLTELRKLLRFVTNESVTATEEPDQTQPFS